MAVFKNEATGQTQEVSGWCGFWAFVFGVFYLLYKEQWKHAVIWTLAVLITAPTGFVPFLVLLIYPFFVPDILKNYYKSKGYKEVQK